MKAAIDAYERSLANERSHDSNPAQYMRFQFDSRYCL